MTFGMVDETSSAEVDGAIYNAYKPLSYMLAGAERSPVPPTATPTKAPTAAPTGTPTATPPHTPTATPSNVNPDLSLWVLMALRSMKKLSRTSESKSLERFIE